ncbi:hypothetical protein NYO67_10582 [Aspergillus flavus]|nr:hypothetical protein NYO67_10582 [Aspergillus flavus]
MELEIFTAPPPPSSSLSPPSTIRRLCRTIAKAQDYIDSRQELNKSFVRHLVQVFQSSLKMSEDDGQLQSDFELYRQHQKSKFEGKSQKRVHNVGPLPTGNAKRRINFRGEEERRRELRRLKRAWKLEREILTQKADRDILPGQKDSQRTRESPSLPYWVDWQGEVV